MDMDSIGSLNDNMSKIERKKLLELLEHYNVTPDKIIKQNDIFIITTKEGNYSIRKIKYSHKGTIRNLQLIDYLLQGGFNNIPGYIKTKAGNELLKYNKGSYYLSQWIDGRECSYSNFNDIKNVAVLLAKFHLKSQGYYNKHIKIDYKVYDWSSRLEKYKEAFSIIMEIIGTKKIKTMFDILYMESIEFFEGQLELSVRLINESNYIRIMQNAQLKYTLCIDDFKFKNMIAGNDDEYYFTCLDNIKYNMVVFDLSKFVKKVMFKKEYSWDFKYARELIDNYCIVNPLSKDELTILLSLIIFPQFFYKLGKRRYIKRKKWGEDKYLTKLYKVTRHIDKQREFVDEYIDYYSIKN